MHILQIFLILLLSVTTSCSKDGLGSVTAKDDVVYTQLEKELKALEADRKDIEETVEEFRSRLQSLSVSPKMHDIAKKNMYSKERYIVQIDQRIAYLKIKLNHRKQYFIDNKFRLSKDVLNSELEKYLIDQKANPVVYPWRDNANNGKL